MLAWTAARPILEGLLHNMAAGRIPSMIRHILAATLLAFGQSTMADPAAPLQVIESKHIELVPGSCQPLTYPSPYVRSGESGDVDVKLTFTWDAAIRSFEVTRRTDHPLLDQFAAQAILTCRFKRLPPLRTSSPPEATLRISWPSGGGSLPTREPRPLHVPCKKPEFPSKARWLEAKGVTEIRFDVNRQGTIVRIDVLTPAADASLDEAAIRSLGSCTLHPWASDNPAEQLRWSRVNYKWTLEEPEPTTPFIPRGSGRGG